MLSHPDRVLVERDAALPGLATVLDPEALVIAVQRACPQIQIDAAYSTYVRYKPGTNCLVAYEFTVGGQRVAAYAKAHGSAAAIKLAKARQTPGVPGPLGKGKIVLQPEQIVLAVAPNDAKLRGLPRVYDAVQRRNLLRKALPNQPHVWNATLHRLRYKPERRYVAQLCADAAPRAILRVYAEHEYDLLMNTLHAFDGAAVRVPRLLGHSRRRHVTIMEWLDGQPLDEMLATPQAAGVMEATGVALRRLHQHPARGLLPRSRKTEAKHVQTAAHAVALVYPDLATQAHELAARLQAWLHAQPSLMQPIHGDCYSDQVLVQGDRVALVDLDQAALGDPAADLGNFIAHLHRAALHGTLTFEQAETYTAALLTGYAADGVERTRVKSYAAIGLLHLAAEPFRRRAPDWHTRMAAIIAHVQTLVDAQVLA